MKNLIVMFGGKSPEHEISVITGLQVLSHVDKTKYNPVPVYVSKAGRWYSDKDFFSIEPLKKASEIPFKYNEVCFDQTDSGVFLKQKKSFLGLGSKTRVDVVYPAFHGGTGEDGSIQGLFETLGLTYCNSGVLGSALGMDKVVMKQLFEHAGINCAPFLYFYRADYENNAQNVLNIIQDKLQFPMFVKPAVGGSSIGVTKATNLEQLISGIEVANSLDFKFLVEQGIENSRELNVSVMGLHGRGVQVSVAEEVFHKSDFLNYDDKYKGNGDKAGKVSGSVENKGMASATRKIPAELSTGVSSHLIEMAKKIFDVLNLSGLVRIDFLLKGDELFVIEPNTIPGSMAFYLWEASGMTFKDMISRQVELAEQSAVERERNTTTYSSNILENFGGVKGKLG